MLIVLPLLLFIISVCGLGVEILLIIFNPHVYLILYVIFYFVYGTVHIELYAHTWWARIQVKHQVLGTHTVQIEL